MIDLRKLSFGGPAAIVTGMGLIVGLDAATAAKSTVVTSLLIIGIADNLTDSLSVHIYQESERLAERDAFRTTVANFFARLFVCISFIVIILLLPASTAIPMSMIWGFVLLLLLSCLLARIRGVGVVSEILKHSAVALAVIALSRAIGAWLPAMIGSP
jgi:VIT1/CCC1 family predicted Fe2+/Mn2+ transporter